MKGGADEVNEGGKGSRTVWWRDTVHHVPCLAVKRGRTKFKQDLLPVSSHWNKAWDIDHYGGHK